jgi:hypothetical protein
MMRTSESGHWRRFTFHRRPHRTLWRKILRRSQRRHRPGATRSVPPARCVQMCGDLDARAERGDQTARSCRWLAEGISRRHRRHPSPHGWRGGQRRPRGGTWSGIRAELPAELIFYRIAFVVGSRNDAARRIVPLIVQTYCVTEFLSPPVQFVFTKKEKKKGEGQWPD